MEEGRGSTCGLVCVDFSVCLCVHKCVCVFVLCGFMKKVSLLRLKIAILQRYDNYAMSMGICHFYD